MNPRKFVLVSAAAWVLVACNTTPAFRSPCEFAMSSDKPLFEGAVWTPSQSISVEIEIGGDELATVTDDGQQLAIIVPQIGLGVVDPARFEKMLRSDPERALSVLNTLGNQRISRAAGGRALARFENDYARNGLEDYLAQVETIAARFGLAIAEVDATSGSYRTARPIDDGNCDTRARSYRPLKGGSFR